ncbi:MAG: hypothetical protein IKC28_00845 [Clostridia bacterium]|nr:hypothetical protein [Clostridia bacterium]
MNILHRNRPTTRWNKRDIFLLILLAVVAVLSVNTVFHTSLHLLDSDTSNDLLLAKHLHDTGRIISTDWYYGSELRVLNSHLILAPLFSLFSDWRKIRFFGVLMMQIILLLSFWYVCKSASLKRKSYLLGGCLLLLPSSVAYGRIVLYNFHYVFYISISFVLVGLLLSFMKDMAKKRSIIWKIIHLCLLLVLSFLASLNGVRQIAITHIPMLFALGVWLLNAVNAGQLQESKEQNKCILWGIAATIAACVSCLAGYKVNQQIAQTIPFQDFSSTWLRIDIALRFEDVLFALLHFFGMRRYSILFSLQGAVSLIGIVAATVMLWFGATRLSPKNYHPDQPTGIRFLKLFFPCVLLSGIFTLFFFSNASHAILYITPNIVWFIPFISAWFSEIPEDQEWLKKPIQPVMLGFVCTVLFISGLCNHMYFLNPKDSTFSQHYEGLSFTNATLVDTIEPLRARLVDEGYDIGYCTYWEGSILTEMSSGALTVVPITYSEEDSRYIYHNVLTDKRNREILPQKPFVCIARAENAKWMESPIFASCELIWEGRDILCYELTDPMVMKQYLDELN